MRVVDFEAYADSAVLLANASLPDLPALRAALADRPSYAERVDRRDLALLRDAQPRLREVFARGSAGDEAGVVERVNALLVTVPVAPRVSGHDAQTWHLHVTSGASPGEDLLAEAAMGLAVTAIDRGPDRFGVCADPDCERAYVDTSSNRSRRYCSARCASRANVAAFRARQRTVGRKRGARPAVAPR